MKVEIELPEIQMFPKVGELKSCDKDAKAAQHFYLGVLNKREIAVFTPDWMTCYEVDVDKEGRPFLKAKYQEPCQR